MSVQQPIQLRGVRVNNLKGIDLDLPARQLIVLCGVSGSGKSSLAYDTLFAEGQRRYLETFSPYARQFLARMQRPEADSIEGMRPTIAVAQQSTLTSNRATVSTATEIDDYLRLLFSKTADLFCLDCNQQIHRDHPESVAEFLLTAPDKTRFMLSFPHQVEEVSTSIEELRDEGFVRIITDQQMVDLSSQSSQPTFTDKEIFVVVDRLTVDPENKQRLLDSLDLAFERGSGSCRLWIDLLVSDEHPKSETINNQVWRVHDYSRALKCNYCGRSYPAADPQLFSFKSTYGSCAACEGSGQQSAFNWGSIVPNRQKTLLEGAILPWQEKPYLAQQSALLQAAKAAEVPIHVSYAELTEQQQAWAMQGTDTFQGVLPFLENLQLSKPTTKVLNYLKKWQSKVVCDACQGKRLNQEALAYRLSDQSFGELISWKVTTLLEFFETFSLPAEKIALHSTLVSQVIKRLQVLQEVGLGYLQLNRPLDSLSTGEAQRVMMTKVLGASLVDALYILDEPTVGLHCDDTEKIISAMRRLVDQDNSVLVVEHEDSVIQAADQVIEIGPQAGEQGGEIVFQGDSKQLSKATSSLTGNYLSQRKQITRTSLGNQLSSGILKLTNAHGNNLKNIDVEFPLNQLCVVSGVSGAGKSSLVQDTLYPALKRKLGQETNSSLPYGELEGSEYLEDCVLIDQQPIGRSPRSNPVTYLKIFDDIRAVFANLPDAKSRNYGRGHFSFNAGDGRCPTCEGNGYLQIDMKFLPDVFVKCSSCKGTRYRTEILSILCRGRNIAEVLSMNIREAFGFFRGTPKLQAKLKRLIDVGLEYLQLGQPSNTLSGGESQRLKLAKYLDGNQNTRTLFVLDEPTTGLHFQDIQQLLQCFDSLLAVGHSLIVIEHNLHFIRCADHIIDLGPGAAESGGNLIASGTVEDLINTPDSRTGFHLKQSFKSL